MDGYLEVTELSSLAIEKCSLPKLSKPCQIQKEIGYWKTNEVKEFQITLEPVTLSI